jgi:hypothetical protein
MYGSVGCASCSFFFFWSAVGVLLCAEACRRARLAAAVLHSLACLFSLLLLAAVQSFQLLSFWATGAISVVPCTVSSVFLTILSTDSFFVLFRKQAQQPSRSEMSELLPWEHVALNRLSKLSFSRWAAAVSTVSDHRCRAAALFLVFLSCSVLMTAATFGGCGCEHPVAFTTSFSRLFSAGVCADDEICHVYAQPGSSSATLAVVFHMVVGRRSVGVPVAALGMVCDAATDCPLYTHRQGRLINNADIAEDRRYIGHVLFADLVPDTLYAATVVFLMSDGSNQSSRRLFRSLPLANESTGDLAVVAGGDYESSGLGHSLLLKGFAASKNDARVIYIGGDLAYENNMRYCYRRLDSVLDDLTELRRNDGSQPLLLTASGNHEAGGWLLATTEEQRRDYFAFYFKYFPSIAEEAYDNVSSYLSESSFYVGGSITSTYHAHEIGGAFWLVLDSNTVNDVKAQVSFIETSLAQWKQRIDAANSTGASKIVVTYHAPAFPSVTPVDDKRTKALRKTVIPILDRYQPYVTWVMEHHDHTYKRTKPLLNLLPVAEGGIVYSGDGSLGVHEEVDAPRAEDFLEVAIPGNYVFHLLFSGQRNKTVEGFAIGESGGILDHFIV